MRELNTAEHETSTLNAFYTDGGEIEYTIEPDTGGGHVDTPVMNYIDSDDEALVRLYLEREDEWAFNEIVNRYSCRIYRLALKFTKNERDANDILQEVFLTLIEKLHTFRNESKFSTWLNSLTRNTSFLYLRKNKKFRAEQLLVDDVSSEEDGTYVWPSEDWRFIPDKLIIQERRREKIESIMQEIPEKYRTVLRLKDLEGRSNKEVGEMLGLSLTAVKSRALRARRRIKEKLSEYETAEMY